MRALIYINKTGNDVVDKLMEKFLTIYCEVKGYDVYDVYSEDTGRVGMSERACFATVGMGVTDHIDVVVTLFKEMVGDSDEEILRTLHNLSIYDIKVVTTKGDLDEYYEEISARRTSQSVTANEVSYSSEELLQRIQDFFNAGE